MGLGDRDIFRFYEDKSIVHSYNFYVDFGYLDYASFIEPYHVVDVEIPTNKFQRESVNYGVTQYSYPVLSKEQPLDIRIVLEEDRTGRVGKMINRMQRRIVHNGLHRAPITTRLGKISIILYDDQKKSIAKWTYRDVYFLGYDNVSLNYDSNDTIKYSVTFGSDVLVYSPMYLKAVNDSVLDSYTGDNYALKSMVDSGRINEYAMLAAKQ